MELYHACKTGSNVQAALVGHEETAVYYQYAFGLVSYISHKLKKNNKLSWNHKFEEINTFLFWKWFSVFFLQVGSETERALLITRATVAEAQVSELQHYVDNHLGRSGIPLMCSCIMLSWHLSFIFTTTCRRKEEISRLCRLVGKQEAGRSQSANSSPC